MKAQILKLAGVKTEKEFYKKFPTEKAFMAKHGKELKKAQLGAKMPGMPVNAPALPTLQNTFSSTPSFGATAKAYGKTAGNDILKGVNAAVEPADISTPAGLAGMIGGIGAGMQQIKDTDKAIKQNKLYGKVSDVVLQAQNTKTEQPKHQYVLPENQLIQNANPLGTGTNYLAANGAMIPNKKRGKLKKAQLGEAIGVANTLADVSKASGQLGGALGGQWSGTGGETGGYTKMLSSFGFLGGLAGGYLDSDQIKEKQQSQAYLTKNNALMQGQQQIKGFQQANNAYVKNGGNIQSHNIDMLRAGGHMSYYTPPSAEAMYTGRAEDGAQMTGVGDVRVGKGYMKPLSDDLSKIIAPSHKHGGTPFANGNGDYMVEAEGNETVRKTYADGGPMDDGSVTIFGNRFINKDAAEFIGVKAGKKFKTQSEELALDQTKFQKKSLQNFEDANSMEVSDMISQIEQRTKLLNGQVFEAKAQMNKDTLDKLGFYQNETGDFAEAHGLEINALDKGMLKPIKQDGKAKFGGKFSSEDMFQKGGKTHKKVLQKKKIGAIDNEDIVIENKNVRRQAPAPIPDPRYSPSSSQFPSPTDDEGNYYMPTTQEEQQAPMVKALQAPSPYGDARKFGWDGTDDYQYKGDVKKGPGSGNWVGDFLTTGLRAAYPFLRSYPMNDLDPSQLNPEYLAASMNQQQPVYAQSYQPLLAQSTSYSLQDQLNEVTSASRAAEKMSAYNPEAAGMIAAQSYGAKNKILGEQFRMNQAGQADVVNQNRATLNDAQFKNLGIFQDQADKTSKARSNTNATNFEISKNIAAKYAKNKSENKQMNVASNMFPAFDFNQNGTIYKNPFYAASFANQGMGKNSGVFDPSSLPESPIPGFEYSISLKKSKARNGAIVKAFKDL